MIRPRSLQSRLALALALTLAALWLVAVLLTGGVLRHELDESLDASLAQTARRLMPLALREAARDGAEGALRLPDGSRGDYLAWVLRDGAGRVRLVSDGADPAALPRLARPGFGRTGRHRLVQVEGRDGFALTLGEPVAHRAEATRETMLSLALPVAVLVPLSLLAVWLMVRLSMRPLRAFRAAIAARGQGALDPVPATGLPSEIAPVAGAVNALLGRVARMLEAERAFTANAAHELRTPLAASLAQVQRLAAETGEPGTRARADQVEAGLKRLTRLSEKLMQLARAEGGGMTGPPRDLVPVLGMLIEEFRQAGAEPGRLHLSLPAGPATSRVDPDAFAILARNLVENALRHGAPDRPVEVRLAGDATLEVTNGGPALSPAALAAAPRPFERGTGTARGGEGAGLGLAIAQAIAEGSGGRLTLASPAPGRPDGFQARFTPPA